MSVLLVIIAPPGESVRFEVVNAQTYAGYVVHVGSLSATTGASIKVSFSLCYCVPVHLCCCVSLESE